MNATVLIIDDDRELCTLLCDFLALDGFAPSAIHDGQEAVDYCRRNNHDAIVLDIMLPGMQGLDVLRHLREFSDTPVLMLKPPRGQVTQ